MKRPSIIDVHGDAEASRQLDAFIRHAGIGISPVTLEQAQIARQAYLDFGKGRHPTGLNFGDCFACALARETGEPRLLFNQKGNPLHQQDGVAQAVMSVGIGVHPILLFWRRVIGRTLDHLLLAWSESDNQYAVILRT